MGHKSKMYAYCLFINVVTTPLKLSLVRMLSILYYKPTLTIITK
jgi:hypothetical protein